jgi:hypothetical protein
MPETPPAFVLRTGHSALCLSDVRGFNSLVASRRPLLSGILPIFLARFSERGLQFLLV